MITLEKWVCNYQECNTVFYVEGKYFLPPCCSECGSSDKKYIQSHGLQKFKMIGEK